MANVPWGAAMLAGAVVGAMSLQYPQLRLTLVIGPWKELPARLHTREIDLAIINISDVRPDDDVEVQPLLEHPAMLVCRANHPLTRQRCRTYLFFRWQHPIYPWGPVNKFCQICRRRCGPQP